MAKKSSKGKNIKEMRVVRSSDHRSHYITGAIPQWTEEDLRLHLYNEILDGPEGPYFVSTTQIIMPKNSLQRLIDTLKNAALSEGKTAHAEVSSMPLDVAVSLDREIFDTDKKATQKKKVQKIRRKK